MAAILGPFLYHQNNHDVISTSYCTCTYITLGTKNAIKVITNFPCFLDKNKIIKKEKAGEFLRFRESANLRIIHTNIPRHSALLYALLYLRSFAFYLLFTFLGWHKPTWTGDMSRMKYNWEKLYKPKQSRVKRSRKKPKRKQRKGTDLRHGVGDPQKSTHVHT